MIRLLAGGAAAAAVWVWWPFPAPGADPVADLIAIHSPRLHAGVRAWHYLAPAVAVIGLMSIGVAAGRVWLAGTGRRPVAGVLPPRPAGADDPSPALVVGEVHHPVAEREVADRRWLVIPELGLYTGILICGAIGSGKTSACMRPFARQLLSWQAGDSRRRVAGLVLEVKGDFCHQVRGILADAGRADDYVELSIGGRWRWNPLGDGQLDSYSLAYTIASLINQPLEGTVLAAGVREPRALDHRAAPDGARALGDAAGTSTSARSTRTGSRRRSPRSRRRSRRRRPCGCGWRTWRRTATSWRPGAWRTEGGGMLRIPDDAALREQLAKLGSRSRSTGRSRRTRRAGSGSTRSRAGTRRTG